MSQIEIKPVIDSREAFDEQYEIERQKMIKEAMSANGLEVANAELLEIASLSF